jgi:hypothetical protein
MCLCYVSKMCSIHEYITRCNPCTIFAPCICNLLYLCCSQVVVCRQRTGCILYVDYMRRHWDTYCSLKIHNQYQYNHRVHLIRNTYNYYHIIYRETDNYDFVIYLVSFHWLNSPTKNDRPHLPIYRMQWKRYLVLLHVIIQPLS